MTRLSWDKPKKIMSSQAREQEYQSDTSIPGTYVPNMSAEDKARWKAKYVGGDDPRVEVRVSITGVQVVMVIRGPSEVELSMNGKLKGDYLVFSDFKAAIEEANARLLLEAELRRIGR